MNTALLELAAAVREITKSDASKGIKGRSVAYRAAKILAGKWKGI